jgi:hypothetical protein
MHAEQYYDYYCQSNNDICQHLPTLRRYATGCDTVVELGVRSIVSTWAFLLGKPKRLIGVDIAQPSSFKEHDQMGCDIHAVYDEADRLGVIFNFILDDSVTAKIPESVDLIFFDTEHSFKRLDAELKAHGNKAQKYLIFHDTETFDTELKPAIRDFLMGNHEWNVREVYTNNNGLTILERG